MELRLDNLSHDDFDLQLLKPSSNTLRTFEYGIPSVDESILVTLQSVDESKLDTLLSFNESILYTIPTILPHLTKLRINWENVSVLNRGPSILWKVCTIFPTSYSSNINEFSRTHTSKLSRKTITLPT